MKCKYCNADIEKDAQFCPNCGKDLSSFKKCVKCGELLDNETVFCPNCGTGQPHKEVVEEPTGSKKWLWAAICLVLLALVGGGIYYFTQDGFTNNAADNQGETENTIVSEDDSKDEPTITFGQMWEFYSYAAGANGWSETLLKNLSRYFKEIGYTEIQNGSFKVPSDFDDQPDLECVGVVYGKNVTFDEWHQKLKRSDKLSYGVAFWKNEQYSETYMTICFKDKESYSSFVDEGIKKFELEEFSPEGISAPFIEGDASYYSWGGEWVLACQKDILYCHLFRNEEH